jgi:hypothetical protein
MATFSKILKILLHRVKRTFLETNKIIRHQLQCGPYMCRNRGMHGVEAWNHRTGDNWSDWGLKSFDASAVYSALILIFYVLELP